MLMQMPCRKYWKHVVIYITCYHCAFWFQELYSLANKAYSIPDFFLFEREKIEISKNWNTLYKLV